MTKEYYNRSVSWLNKLVAGTINKVELFRLGLHWWCDEKVVFPIKDPDNVVNLLIWYADNHCDAVAYYNLGVLFQEGILRPKNIELAKWYFLKALNEGMSVERELFFIENLQDGTTIHSTPR